MVNVHSAMSVRAVLQRVYIINMRQPTYKDAATQIALLLIVVSVQVLGAAAAPPTYAQQLAVQQQAAYQAQLQAQQQAAYQAQLQAQQQAQLAAQQQAAGVVAQPAAAAAQAAVAVPAPAVAAPAPAVAPPAPAVAAPAPALAVPAPAVAQPAVATTAAAVPAPKPAAPAPTAAPTPKPVPSPPPPPPPPAPPGMIPRSFLQGTIPANKTALPVIRVPEGTKIKLTWVCDIAGNLYVGAGKEELIQCPSGESFQSCMFFVLCQEWISNVFGVMLKDLHMAQSQLILLKFRLKQINISLCCDWDRSCPQHCCMAVSWQHTQLLGASMQGVNC